MGLGHSPRIVTDGLVLCLDAANARSYPGTGTTWTDRSASGYDGTLTNMDASNFSSDSAGFFNFDGVNEHVRTSFRINSGNTYSYSVWYKSSSTNHQNLIGSYQPGYSTLNLDINYTQSTNSASVGYISVFCQFGGNSSRYRFSNSNSINLSDGKWHNITCCAELGVQRGLYFDGQQVGTTVYQSSTGSYNSTALDTWLGHPNIGGSLGGKGLVGSAGQFLIYNKFLESKEVLQNYEATKGRYA